MGTDTNTAKNWIHGFLVVDRRKINMKNSICNWSKRDEETKKQIEILHILHWVADFDCDTECYNKSMETHPGVELCVPCRARKFLEKNAN
jgi:hypothetical protein